MTASVWRQLKTFLWPEVKKWESRLRWDRIGRPPFTPHELQYMTLQLRTGAVTTVASDTAAHIEGAHADQLLYVFDEAKAIKDDIFDAAEGAASADDPTTVIAKSTGIQMLDIECAFGRRNMN